MLAARGEGLGAAACHLPVTAMALLRGRLWRRRFISQRERGCSWPWPCPVNQLPIVASISKEKSLPDPRGSGEFTDLRATQGPSCEVEEESVGKFSARLSIPPGVVMNAEGCNPRPRTGGLPDICTEPHCSAALGVG